MPIWVPKAANKKVAALGPLPSGGTESPTVNFGHDKSIRCER